MIQYKVTCIFIYNEVKGATTTGPGLRKPTQSLIQQQIWKVPARFKSLRKFRRQMSSEINYEIVKLPDIMVRCMATNGGNKFQACIISALDSFLIFHIYLLLILNLI